MTIRSILQILLNVAIATVKTDFAIATTDKTRLNDSVDKQDFQTKIDSITHHGFLIASNNPDEATKLADSIIILSQQQGDAYGVAVGYNLKGYSFERRTSNDSAFHYYFKCLKLLETYNFPLIRSEVLYNIGDLHEVTGHYDSAAIYIFSSLNIADSISDSDLQAKNLRIVGNLMYKQSRFDEALNYYFMALKNFSVSKKFTSLLARTQENIALTYIKLDSSSLAEKYFARASEIYERNSDERGKARVNLNWAMLRIKQGLTNEAIQRTTNALKFFISINHHNGIAECYMTLAEAYLKQKKYHNAEHYAKLMLDEIKRYEDKDLEHVAYRILEKVSYEEGQIEQAYVYQSKSLALFSSIYNESKDALITELLVRYNLKKAEQNTRLLQEQNIIDNLKIFKQKQQALWLSLAIVLLVAIIILVFYVLRIRQKHKVQETRLRISSDLHDDLGSGLSTIAMLSEVVKQHLTDKQDVNTLEKISLSAQQSLEKMSERVWSLNPKNDSLESLISYIRKYTAEYFEPTAIECKINLPKQLPSITLSGEQRRNIFLVVKEVLHNIIKHADATCVEMDIALNNHQLAITIHDNGKGIDLSHTSSFGNGLSNMQKRMKETGGSFSIENQNGTTVLLALHLS